MRAPLSIIIPTLNAEADLAGALVCLGEGLQAGLIREVVVSDGGSRDQTRVVADEAGAVLVTGPAGRGGQLRRGADEAEGDWFLFLHADTQLGPGWTEAVLEHVRDRAGKAGYFRLGFRAEGAAPRMVARWANLRARMVGLPYGDQGLLIRRDLYQRCGGYPDIPLMEDVAIARALKGRLAELEAVAWTSAERYQRRGWVRRGGRNLLTLARFMMGADPERLARGYGR